MPVDRQTERYTECQHELAWLCERKGEHIDAFDTSSLMMDIRAICSETRRGSTHDLRAQVVIASINQVFAYLFPEATDPCGVCGHAWASHHSLSSRSSGECFVIIGSHGLNPVMCECMEYMNTST